MDADEMDDSWDRDSAEIEDTLKSQRPVPSAVFRGELRRRVSSGERWPRPQRLRLWIGAHAVSGFLLLSVAAAGIAGAGPLAP